MVAVQGTNQARRLAFITYKELDQGAAYRGAALITDDRCRPVEFRCTSPIRPNAVQRTLYGQQLLPYITNDLMAVPLVRAVREKPAVVLVNNDIFLDARLRWKSLCFSRGGKERRFELAEPSLRLMHAKTSFPQQMVDFNPLS